ncbi:hypothetical protein B0J13DRAFT_526329 [Dactylonectria estremocensis]|uniref:Uncharacterized protein n=1 Tax=Dactylonectria estremocensis TaxID=1079267 RepID=A0A9P9EQX6_9HYPO|nr:hypothetical protein B0J13DRAFT_526329 [Dactylonectria estremocensis]
MCSAPALHDAVVSGQQVQLLKDDLCGCYDGDFTHQAKNFKEVQVGVFSFRDRWFISSLEQHDFLLASMVVCFELGARSPGQQSQGEQFSREEMVEALKSSKLFWNAFKGISTEARQVYDMLSAMLGRASIDLEQTKSYETPMDHILKNFSAQGIPDMGLIHRPSHQQHESRRGCRLGSTLTTATLRRHNLTFGA